MKLSPPNATFLKSKIARRIFFLFVGCALLPLLVLTILTFTHVTQQIKSQSLDRLQQSSKTHGLSIYERLLSMESDLQFLAAGLVPTVAEPSLALGEAFFRDRLSQRFAVIYLVRDGAVSHLLMGNDAEGRDLVVAFQDNGEKNQLLFSNEEGGADAFLAVPLERNTTHTSFLAARINTTYLWGIGHENILPPMTELCIVDQARVPLVTSFAIDAQLLQEIAFRAGGEGGRQFEYLTSGDGSFLVSFWPLYLKGRFNAPNLTVILRQNRADVLAPLDDFKTIFPLVVLLSLWVVLLLSMVFIRRYMVPVEKLQEATHHIARRDFSHEVDVRSGDEFESLAHSFNSMSRRLHKQFHTLETIADINQTILSSLHSKEIIDTALARLCQFLECDASQIILFKNKKSNLAASYTHVARHRTAAVEEALEIPPDARDELRGKDRLIRSSQEAWPAYLAGLAADQARLIVQLPLVTNGELHGVINLAFQTKDLLSDDDCRQARQLADQVTIALENARLIETLEEMNWGTLQALARTVDAKSPWTAGHSERVTELAIKIAKVMGCDDRAVMTIHQAALVHDIGKIGVPLAILDKPGTLSSQEFDHIKEHPVIGARILEPITAFADAISIVLQHHERCDGSGYPGALQGDEICLGARILAVADVYDALISERPYRQGWVLDQVLEHIQQESGKKFDAEVVKAFSFVIQ
ncbi:HD domain-containing phosphohydrolase [Desulfurivibrio sp. D14AmB]|uniref:HD domain-containing phosphohydrolase n=1 Tax=Desulfurivibrio sp. D14AmB TaxID=3374370 RepID=UPI00376EE9C3